MAEASTYVGLDVHRESIDGTVAEAGANGEVRKFGAIGGDREAVAKRVRRVRQKGRVLRFVYESGPCGFEICRFLTEQGPSCALVRPSQIPRRAGDGVKTDRRDVQSEPKSTPSPAMEHTRPEAVGAHEPTRDPGARRVGQLAKWKRLRRFLHPPSLSTDVAPHPSLEPTDPTRSTNRSGRHEGAADLGGGRETRLRPRGQHRATEPG